MRDKDKKERKKTRSNSFNVQIFHLLKHPIHLCPNWMRLYQKTFHSKRTLIWIYNKQWRYIKSVRESYGTFITKGNKTRSIQLKTHKFFSLRNIPYTKIRVEWRCTSEHVGLGTKTVIWKRNTISIKHGCKNETNSHFA